MEISLNFKGPYTKSRFCSNDKGAKPELPDGSERPGVYIWGFQIKGRFIPYYVGKIQSSIQSRINKHISDILKADSTYMRLNIDYIEGDAPYYTDENFPLISMNYSKDKIPEWYSRHGQYFNSKIDYLNNREFLLNTNKCRSTPLPGSKDYPKSLLADFEDYFSNERMKDQYRVCYADCSYTDYPVSKQDEKIFYEVIEAFTKFSLKGKTVSKSLAFNTLKNKMNMLDISKISIRCGELDIFKISASEDFYGYN